MQHIKPCGVDKKIQQFSNLFKSKLDFINDSEIFCICFVTKSLLDWYNWILLCIFTFPFYLNWSKIIEMNCLMFIMIVKIGRCTLNIWMLRIIMADQVLLLSVIKVTKRNSKIILPRIPFYIIHSLIKFNEHMRIVYQIICIQNRKCVKLFMWSLGMFL